MRKRFVRLGRSPVKLGNTRGWPGLRLILLVLACFNTGPVLGAEQARGRSGEVERRRTESSPATRETTETKRNRRTDVAATAHGSEATAGKKNSRREASSPTQTDGRQATSRAARRQTMRGAEIPTSQQPVSQSRNKSGREYTYQAPAKNGGTELKSVQQQTQDRSHEGQPHWEAGSVKTDPRTGEVRNNPYGRPKLKNSKSKTDY